MLGILSAIAIPALTKYLRKAKTSEARVAVAQIFDGMCAYYEKNRRCPTKGEGGAGITPALAINCNDGPGGRCVPSEVAAAPGHYPVAAWTENPVWAAIGFRQEQAHYFHYDVRWNQGPKTCEFEARAFGDLDDDGVYSTYERSGVLDKDGVSARAGLLIHDELE
jgi:type IV pilus assembly protein PilA